MIKIETEETKEEESLLESIIGKTCLKGAMLLEKEELKRRLSIQELVVTEKK